MSTKRNAINRILILAQDDLETLPYHRVFAIVDYFKNKTDWIDVLYYDRAFDKEVSSIKNKFSEGIHNFFQKPRIKNKADQNITYYGIRRLPLDGILSTWSQDAWIYRQFHKINKMKYDFCISEAPGPARIARWLKNQGVAKYFIYDDTDYFPGFAERLRSQAIVNQEKRGIQSADLVVCVGQKLAELRTQQKVKKIEIIPNGVSVTRFSKAQIKKAHPPSLIYVGSLADWLNLEIIIREFPALLKKIPTLRFLIIGDGPKRNSLTALVNELHLKNHVLILGQKTPEKVVDYLSESDIGIILPKPSILWEYACPIKLFEYAAAGLPVLATAVGETEKLVNQMNIGRALPYNVKSWKEAIENLFANPVEFETYRNNAIHMSKQYDWSLLMERYYNAIMGLTEETRAPH